MKVYMAIAKQQQSWSPALPPMAAASVSGSLAASRRGAARPVRPALLALLRVIAPRAEFAPEDVAKLMCVSKEAKEVVEQERVWTSVRLASPNIPVAHLARYVMLRQKGVAFVGDVTVWFDSLWDSRRPVVGDHEPNVMSSVSVSDVLQQFPEAFIGARRLEKCHLPGGLLALMRKMGDSLDASGQPLESWDADFLDWVLARLGVRRFAFGWKNQGKVLRWAVGSPPKRVPGSDKFEDDAYW